MCETLLFYGPVQGMVRTDNLVPVGYSESRILADKVKATGCVGCLRLNATQTSETSSSYPCEGVGWIETVDGYLYQHQGHAVRATDLERCRLIGQRIEVSENLVKKK